MLEKNNKVKNLHASKVVVVCEKKCWEYCARCKQAELLRMAGIHRINIKSNKQYTHLGDMSTEEVE